MEVRSQNAFFKYYENEAFLKLKFEVQTTLAQTLLPKVISKLFRVVSHITLRIEMVSNYLVSVV